MARSPDQIDVYLEIGKSRVFAGALDWPGWCRSGRDESSALRALFDYGPRYEQVMRAAKLEFRAPADPSGLAVVERLAGTTTTDFGAPDVAPSGDERPVDPAAARRFESLLKACWRAFDVATKMAAGRSLRKGPRGGGRDLGSVVEHVLGADAAYLSQLGWKRGSAGAANSEEALGRIRQEIMTGLAAAVAGEIPALGPRGGRRWGPRYFVRRVAWHVLDHAWEIEDRTE